MRKREVVLSPAYFQLPKWLGARLEGKGRSFSSERPGRNWDSLASQTSVSLLNPFYMNAAIASNVCPYLTVAIASYVATTRYGHIISRGRLYTLQGGGGGGGVCTGSASMFAVCIMLGF